MTYENRKDVYDKIDREGGLEETLRYGLIAADMPEGDVELGIAWAHAETVFAAYERAAERVMNLLEEE